MADTTLSTPPESNREKIAKTVTYFVLSLTGIIAIGAIIVIRSEPAGTDKFGHFKDIIAILLPLWGTWIGTVLAYYFSKDNFESANKSVQQMVDKLTTEKKLANVKAKDVMITKDKLIAQVIKEGEDLSKFKLKEDCIDFLEANKIKRVIILDEKDRAKYVIHRDLISYFITNEILAGRPVQNATLKDMYEKGSPEIKNTIDNSVKFIGENANLLEAKNIIDQYKSCQDVFITKNGNPDESIFGWITNITISQNSIV